VGEVVTQTLDGDETADATPAPLAGPEYAALGGAVLAIGGTLLPWRVSAEGTTVGFAANGFLAVFAAFAVVAVVAVVRGTRTGGRAALVGGLAIAAIATHWLALVAGLDDAVVGVFVTLVAGLVIAGGGGLRLARDR
jgi:hypothetical protein